MKFRDLRRVRAEPGMTAMIDIIFLLLLFFVLSSSFVLQPGVKVELPRTVTQEHPVRKDLILIISRDERVFLNNDQVPLKSLWGRLIEELKVQSEGMIIIRADKGVPHGMVVQVMDIAKQAGALRMSIATVPTKRVEKKKTK